MKLSVFLDHVVRAAEQTGRTEEEILRIAHDCGVTGIELNLEDIRSQGAALAARLKQAGFEISCIYMRHDWTKGDYSSGDEQVDAALRLGASGILVVPGFVAEDEAKEMNALSRGADELFDWMDGNETVRHMVRGLNRMVERADGRIFVSLEDYDYWAAPYAGLNGLKYFMDRVPGLSFTMDCGNFAYSDEDAMEGFRALRDRIVHVHTKDRGEDAEVVSRKLSYNQGLLPAAAGDGYLPVGDVVKELLTGGYRSWFALEFFGSRDHLDYIRRSAAYLKSLE